MNPMKRPTEAKSERAKTPPGVSMTRLERLQGLCNQKTANPGEKTANLGLKKGKEKTKDRQPTLLPGYGEIKKKKKNSSKKSHGQKGTHK